MIIRLLYFLLIVSCIFDSSDLILGLKVPIFVLLIFYSVISGKFNIGNNSLFKYVFVFSVFLPLISFSLGYVTNIENYDNPNLFGAIKPYLFLFLSFSFQSDRRLQDDVIKILAYTLLALSIAIICLLLLYLSELVPWEILYEFGDKYVLYSVGERSFGAFSINRVYFHSSPMLVFALCYFISDFIKQHQNKSLYIALFISVSMLLSGTRNNMIMGIAPYLILFYIHGERREKTRILFIAFLGAVYLVSQEFVMSLFDKSEASNSTKLGFLQDYEIAFSNIRTWIFGDGLDSYFFTKHRGRVNNSELTYFELFRRFGLFGGSMYLYLMIMPSIKLFKTNEYKWLGLAYGLYLIMIISNPFFFSSNGMIILSIVLVVCFRTSLLKRRM